jgi:quinol monooxygenase YgiN
VSSRDVKIITAQVSVNAEHWDAARELAEAHSRASRDEPGCLSHDWFPHPSEAHTIFFFERWRDQAAIDEHFARTYSARLVASFKGWARSPMTLRILEVGEAQEVEL